MGRGARSFKEHYNGNSYQIKNIRIEMSTSPYVGLFGELGGGTVLENIIMCAEPGKGIIDNQYCPYSGGDGYREPVTGALAGMVWVGGNQESHITIKNCSASGYIVKYSGKIPQNSGFYRYISVGGLVGSLFSGKLENCSAANTIVVDSNDLRGFRQQLGGLVGTAGNANNNSNYSVIENCYSGGEIVPDKNETITPNYLSGGLIGNGAGHDQQQSYQGIETQINNCYTYCNISESKSNANGAVPSFNGFYYIAPNIKTTEKISGGYYLLRDEKDPEDPMENGYSYTEMSDGTLLRALGGNAFETGNTSNKDAGFHAVTTTEGNGANVDGKYSFPNLSALEGKNYPFPAVIQQKDLIFSTADQVKYVYVHYGDWPTNGPYWENGFDTMDIFLDMDQDTNYTGYATKVFYLNPNSLLTSKPDPNDFESSVDSVAKVVAVGDIDSRGYYPVTVQALNKGTTNLTLKDTTASFTLEVTVDIQILSSHEKISLKENANEDITLSAVANAADPQNAKHFETEEDTSWKVESDNGGITTGTLVEVSQKDNTTSKNVWNVLRNGMGKVTLTATFTYNYHGNEFITEKFIEVSQPDTIGLSVENKFYAAYLLDDTSDEITATGVFTEYAVDKPYAGKGDFFLYLDSGVKDFSESGIRIEQVEVNGQPITKDDASSTSEKECFITDDGIYVWLDKQQTSDNLYKYLSGDIYRKIDSGELTPVENVKLKLTLKDGNYSYIFDVIISKVETKKLVEVQYLDENGNVKTAKSILSGKNKLLTREEAIDAGFVAPSGKVLGGWQLLGTNDQYALGGEYQFAQGSTQFQIVWKDFDITFVLNGGQLDSGYNYEEFLPTGEEVTKTGYEFLGWYDNPAFEGDVKTQLPAEDDLNRTFYAKWRTLTTELILNDGSSEKLKETVLSGSTAVTNYEMVNVSHDGYILFGWYTKDETNPGVLVLDTNGKFVLDVPGYTNSTGFVTTQESLQLYALWGKESTKSTKFVPTDKIEQMTHLRDGIQSQMRISILL